MSKRPQLLLLDPPEELTFRGPLSYLSSTKLSLTNPTNFKICYKVKITMPERYCVTPKLGIIDPGKTVSIDIQFKAKEFDMATEKPPKFKIVTAEAPLDIEDVSKWLNEVEPQFLMESKLQCRFERLPEWTAETGCGEKEDQTNETNFLKAIGDVLENQPPSRQKEEFRQESLLFLAFAIIIAISGIIFGKFFL